MGQECDAELNASHVSAVDSRSVCDTPDKQPVLSVQIFTCNLNMIPRKLCTRWQSSAVSPAMMCELARRRLPSLDQQHKLLRLQSSARSQAPSNCKFTSPTRSSNGGCFQSMCDCADVPPKTTKNPLACQLLNSGRLET